MELVQLSPLTLTRMHKYLTKEFIVWKKRLAHTGLRKMANMSEQKHAEYIGVGMSVPGCLNMCNVTQPEEHYSTANSERNGSLHPHPPCILYTYYTLRLKNKIYSTVICI